MSMIAGMRRLNLGDRLRRYSFRLHFLERSMAPAAELIAGTELNEQAVVATNDFSGIYRGESRGHLDFGSCQSTGTPRSRWSGSNIQGNLTD